MTRVRAFALAAVCLVASLPTSGLAACRVMALGDSNTWGANASGGRHNEDVRWPRVLAQELSQIAVIEAGQVGRRTDLGAGRPLNVRGPDNAAPLPLLIARHMPLDLVVIMLGTNDLQSGLSRDPTTIARSAFSLAKIVQRHGAGRALVVTPPPLRNPERGRLAHLFGAAAASSEELRSAYAAEAQTTRIAAFDAGTVVQADGSDGVHLSAESQVLLGQALAPKVAALLGDCSN